jgi:hypothetical protein
MTILGQTLNLVDSLATLVLFSLLGANLVVLVAMGRLRPPGTMPLPMRRALVTIVLGLGWGGLFLMGGAKNSLSLFALLGVFVNLVTLLLVVFDASLSSIRRAIEKKEK